MLEQLRLLIPDNATPYMFSDPELEVFLELNDDDVRLAAADAIESLVSQMAMTGRLASVRTDDLQVSEKDTVEWFKARAQKLRDDAAEAANEDFRVVYPFGIREPCRPEATAWPTFLC